MTEKKVCQSEYRDAVIAGAFEGLQRGAFFACVAIWAVAVAGVIVRAM